MLHSIFVQFQILSKHILWFFLWTYWPVLRIRFEIVGGVDKTLHIWGNCPFVIFLRGVQRGEEFVFLFECIATQIILMNDGVMLVVNLFEDYFSAFCKLRIGWKQFVHIGCQTFGLKRFITLECCRCFDSLLIFFIELRCFAGGLQTFVLWGLVNWLYLFFDEMVDALFGYFISFALELLQKRLSTLLHVFLHRFIDFVYKLPFDKFILFRLKVLHLLIRY